MHNSFRRRWIAFFRALIAVGVGWLFEIAYATAADAINRGLASTPAEIEALNNGDGAKFAFAAVLGWVLPTIIVGASWVIHGLVVPKIALTQRCRGRCAIKPRSAPDLDVEPVENPPPTPRIQSLRCYKQSNTPYRNYGGLEGPIQVLQLRSTQTAPHLLLASNPPRHFRTYPQPHRRSRTQFIRVRCSL